MDHTPAITTGETPQKPNPAEGEKIVSPQQGDDHPVSSGVSCMYRARNDPSRPTRRDPQEGNKTEAGHGQSRYQGAASKRVATRTHHATRGGLITTHPGTDAAPNGTQREPPRCTLDGGAPSRDPTAEPNTRPYEEAHPNPASNTEIVRVK